MTRMAQRDTERDNERPRNSTITVTAEFNIIVSADKSTTGYIIVTPLSTMG